MKPLLEKRSVTIRHRRPLRTQTNEEIKSEKAARV
jgi:hypothetical protein